MNILTRILVWLYAQSLKLYPDRFRADFGDEMNAVFMQAIKEHSTTGEVWAVFLREFRNLPSNLIQEHWYARTKRVFPMIKKPEWIFYPGWIILNTIAVPLALGGTFVILALIRRWLGDWVDVNGFTHTTVDYFFSFVFPPMIWLSTSGLQYFLLRPYMHKSGWWILATGAGWLLLIATIQLINLLLGQQYVWNSNNHWILLLIGLSIGSTQWLFLRRSVPYSAAWWIVVSLAGWGMIGPLVGLPFTSILELLAIGFIPAIPTALFWWIIFRPQQPGYPTVLS